MHQYVKHSKYAGIDASSHESNIHILKGADGSIKMQPDMYDFFNSIPLDTDNKTYLLFNVMGASDYYGCNLNGDTFLEKDLKTYFKTFERVMYTRTTIMITPRKVSGKLSLPLTMIQCTG